ncbi:MAG: DUF3313 domain-containing protein [Phycisphaeraceae bacterium]|nr:DUF3313 domain-containing protein [Phycisphaeraceae bacterium]
MPKSRIVQVTTLAMLLAGCANSNNSGSDRAETNTLGEPRPLDVNTLAPPRHSGLISDYARLRPSPEFPGTLVWRSDKLGQYKRFIVDPVVVVPSETSRGLPLTEKDKQRLAADFRYELVDILQATYPVITVPAPRTARIKTAITEVARSAGPNNDWFRWEGGAAAEMEIVDSLTGEPLASAIDSSLVKTRESGKVTDPYSDTKLVFRSWAARLGKMLLNLNAK